MNGSAVPVYSDMFRAIAPSAGRGAIGRMGLLVLQARRAIWMTALCRAVPQASARLALSADEIALVDRIVRGARATTTLAEALARLAAIGGASPAPRRAGQPFAVARGLSRIAVVQTAARLRAEKYIERP